MTTYNYAEVYGHKIFYREAGDRRAPTIVLLHGFLSSSHIYRNLIPKLADNLHVVALSISASGIVMHPAPRSFHTTSITLRCTWRDCPLKFFVLTD